MGLEAPKISSCAIGYTGRKGNAMKRLFFFINETGGYFLSNEEELCKAYCKEHG